MNCCVEVKAPEWVKARDEQIQAQLGEECDRKRRGLHAYLRTNGLSEQAPQNNGMPLVWKTNNRYIYRGPFLAGLSLLIGEAAA